MDSHHGQHQKIPQYRMTDEEKPSRYIVCEHERGQAARIWLRWESLGNRYGLGSADLGLGTEFLVRRGREGRAGTRGHRTSYFPAFRSRTT